MHDYAPVSAQKAYLLTKTMVCQRRWLLEHLTLNRTRDPPKPYLQVNWLAALPSLMLSEFATLTTDHIHPLLLLLRLTLSCNSFLLLLSPKPS